MKKLLALALALVLVLSLSASALAGTPGPSVGADGNTSQTKVSVAVDSSNISVTVPLSFTIVAKVGGGPAEVPNGYTIKNNSTIPVKVDKISVALAEGDWVFKNESIVANTVSTTTGKNELFLSVNGKALEVVTDSSTESTSWNIPAGNGTNPGLLNLPIVASTSMLNTIADFNNLITITYVISAGSHPTT